MCFCPFGACRLRLLTHPPRNLLRTRGCVGWLRMAVGWLRGYGRDAIPSYSICADRCGCLHRPMRMSAPTDADVCADRCGPCREDFLALASGKAERRPALTTLLVLTYRNDQQCIIKKKSGATFMSHRFLCVYKYRLNGNEDGLLLCKDRANQVFCVFRVTLAWAKSIYCFFSRYYRESNTVFYTSLIFIC